MVRNLEFCEVLSRNSVIDDAQESRFQAAKRSEMCSAVMIGLWFPYNHETSFYAWQRSHMGCSSLLYGRFADSQESRFQASKRSNMISAVL